MTAIVGYARTSTVDQLAGIKGQVRELKAAGATKLYTEQVSSIGKRKELDAALDFLREGDSFMVTKLDRLARSTRHLMEIVDYLQERKVALRILDMGLDTSTPSGELILTVMGAIAQFERSIMLERQREGIAKAKNEGKYKGRPKHIDAPDVREMKKNGASIKEIMAKHKISRASVYRLLTAIDSIDQKA
jgi:DNA invertase Pin-like site-specific DNA recombinase